MNLNPNNNNNNTRNYGRYYSQDNRDFGYQLGSIASLRESRLKTKHWRLESNQLLNQMAEPSCVGFGWAHWLMCSPIRQRLNPSGIYQIAQYFDEWEGNNYEGTSVRAGAKVLQMLGAIRQYRWTLHALEVAKFVCNFGPVVIGVNWYEGMELNNSNSNSSILELTGEVLGGHCVCITGYNARTDLFKIANSWGINWGDNGFCYLRYKDLQKLLGENGECCIGLEQPFT